MQKPTRNDPAPLPYDYQYFYLVEMDSGGVKFVSDDYRLEDDEEFADRINLATFDYIRQFIIDNKASRDEFHTIITESEVTAIEVEIKVDKDPEVYTKEIEEFNLRFQRYDEFQKNKQKSYQTARQIKELEKKLAELKLKAK